MIIRNETWERMMLTLDGSRLAIESEYRRRQYEWMRDNGHPIGPGHEWLDADEFSFTFSEFS